MQVARRFDWPDFAALLVSGVLAAVAPLQVFLLAYAVLGPFHYLTEIAWLHKKEFYFTEGLVRPRTYVLLAIVLSALAPMQYIVHRNFGFWVIGAALLLSLTVWLRNYFVLAVLAAAGLAAKFLLHSWIFFLAIMVPTLVHVYLFTGAFMLSGAMRKKGSWTKWVNPALLLVIPVALAVLRFHYGDQSSFWLRGEAASFGSLHAYLAANLRHTLHMDAGLLQDPLVAAVIRVFAFVYLFHYLNWFAKTELLQWHKISSRQWVVISILYAASLACYLWSFTVGFIAATFLSMLHVLLEFPLNWHTLRFLFHRISGRSSEPQRRNEPAKDLASAT